VTAPVLHLEGLVVRFQSDAGAVPAVRGVDLDVGAGDALGIVGESGSGKSTVALALLGLHDPQTTTVTARQFRFLDRDLLAATPSEWRTLRGHRLAMVFQDPMTALNPYLCIGTQLAEVLQVHRDLSRNDALHRAHEALLAVGIADPGQRLQQHPHELSGGMRQRVCLAMALLCDPALLVADEPTTALDVTIQAQVLRLVQQRQAGSGRGLVLITHDLGVVAHVCQRVAVLYAGQVVEMGATATVLRAPRHPYTVGLLRSRPGSMAAKPGAGSDKRPRLHAIAGAPPLPGAITSGCPFAPRCALADARCRRDEPALETLADGHAVRCFRHADVPVLLAESAAA
jgi:oligopeptide/dipeptide ABC transporter ATP-binding protein